MGMWNANSDLDYYNECNGPYPEIVERTCRDCGERFRMVVEGEYQLHVLCERCDSLQQARNERAKAEQASDPPILKSQQRRTA